MARCARGRKLACREHGPRTAAAASLLSSADEGGASRGVGRAGRTRPARTPLWRADRVMLSGGDRSMTRAGSRRWEGLGRGSG
jgi:hypothetical protein